jgi:large subunit ribosomal protein L33
LTRGFGSKKETAMAKKSEAREIIRLVCTEDGKSYYTTQKNKRNTTERLELMKYNKNLRKHTLHREKK